MPNVRQRHSAVATEMAATRHSLATDNNKHRQKNDSCGGRNIS